MSTDVEEIMNRSGFDRTTSIIVAMRGPADWRFKGKWYGPLYWAWTIFAESVVVINYLTIALGFILSNDILERCYTGFPLTSITLNVARSSYLFFRRDRMARLIQDYDRIYSGSEELRKEVEENAKTLRLMPRVMVLLTVVPMAPWCFMPILNAVSGGEWVISVPSIWPFDPLSNVYFFSLVSVMQTLSATFNTLRVVLFDNMFIVYGFRQLALCRHLRRELRRILSIRPAYGGKKAASQMVTTELRQWVINHQESLRLAKELQELFSPCHALQFSTTCLSCCTTAFVGALNDDVSKITMCFLYALGISVELIITCRTGDLITNETDHLVRGVNGTNVDELEPGVYKYWLRMILTRAKKPIHLSAFGVFPLNIVTFKNVMTSTYSFFTLLIQMKDRQE